MKKYIKGIGFYAVLLGMIFVIYYLLSYSSEPSKLEFGELVNSINNQQVKVLEITNNNAKITFKDGKEAECYIPSATVLYYHVGDTLNQQIADGSLEYKTPEPPTPPWWVSMLPTLFLIIVMVGFWIFFMRQSQGGGKGAMNFGRSTARIHNPGKDKVTFKDVAGADVEKGELEEVVDFLKDPAKYQRLGAKIPRGVLLVGPPGTGKTLIAKAVAGEAGVPFFSISGSDFVEMFVGVGASRVRDLFEQAKKASPSIVFIDEIDAVGRQRGAGLGGGHDEREQTLNQLLVEMDGFSANQGVIVIAATNRPDILDSALLRPGRFDRQVVVDAPDLKAREEILKVHARNKPLAEGVDLSVIAKSTAGFTGADLANLLNEAALLAARYNKSFIEMKEIEDAMIKVVVGTEKKTRNPGEKERRLTAYHEAGHAIVTKLLPSQDPVHQISIIPRGRAGGYTLHLPTEDKHYETKNDMIDQILVLLGGRAAEKIKLDDISTGASNDIERATKIARAMVTKFGMSDKIGPIHLGSSNDEVFIGRDFVQSKNLSEVFAAEVDREVRDIIENSYERCIKLLEENEDKLEAVAKVLMEKEKISGEEFEKVFNGEALEQEIADESITNNESPETKEICENSENADNAENTNDLEITEENK